MRLAVIAAFFGSVLIGQTGGVNIINGVIDLSGAGHTVSVKVVASVGALPSTGCTVGELAFVTAATLGQQVYSNSGAGSCVWTQILAGSGGTTVNNLKCNHCTLNGTALTQPFTNASVTGTTNNKLAKLTGAPSTVVISSAGDTTGAIGIVDSGGGTTGSAEVTLQGTVGCVFDGATTAGHYVTISASVAGDCHDGGATMPAGTQVIGRVLSTNGGGGTYNVALFGAEFTTIPAVYASGYYLTDGTTYYIPTTMQAATLPSAGTYTWVNQGSATETANGNALTLFAPASASQDIKLRVVNIGATTQLTAAIQCTLAQLDFSACGIGFRESGTGKLSLLQLYTGNTASGTTTVVNHFASPTTYTSTPKSISGVCSSFVWGRLVVSGSNLLYQYSCDGVHYIQILSEAKTAGFTTAPDQWAYFANTQNSIDVYTTLLSWTTQ